MNSTGHSRANPSTRAVPVREEEPMCPGMVCDHTLAREATSPLAPGHQGVILKLWLLCR